MRHIAKHMKDCNFVYKLYGFIISDTDVSISAITYEWLHWYEVILVGLQYQLIHFMT